VEDVQTPAFVLRTRPYSESDVIAVFLTADYGKLAGIARGARRSRNRFAGPALEPFHQLHLRFARRPHSDLAFLHESRVVHSHHHISDRLEAFAWASYLCELTDVMTPDRDPCPDLYSLFAASMAALAATARPEPIAHHYILGLLDHAGWAPDFSSCGICHCQVTPASRPILDSRGSGIVCAAHEAERLGADPGDASYQPSRRIIPEELLNYVAAARATPPEDAPAELEALASALLERLIDLHLPRQLKSRAFLTSMRQAGPPSGTSGGRNPR